MTLAYSELDCTPVWSGSPRCAAAVVRGFFMGPIEVERRQRQLFNRVVWPIGPLQGPGEIGMALRMRQSAHAQERSCFFGKGRNLITFRDDVRWTSTRRASARPALAARSETAITNRLRG